MYVLKLCIKQQILPVHMAIAFYFLNRILWFCQTYQAIRYMDVWRRKSSKSLFFWCQFWVHSKIEMKKQRFPILPAPNMHTTATAKSLQSCPTLCNLIDGSPPGFPVPGILQARTLEWPNMHSLFLDQYPTPEWYICYNWWTILTHDHP